MSIIDTIKGIWKKVYDPQWQKLSGPSFGGYYDEFNRQREPEALDLIRAYEDTAYSCANLLASTVASVPLRLYVRTCEGDLRPKCSTKSINKATLKRLGMQPALSRGITKAMDVREVTEHPLLELLHNTENGLNLYDLLELTDLYQEIIGSSYWYLQRDHYNIPSHIHILPSQYVTPMTDEKGNILGYRMGTGDSAPVYKPEVIVHFRFLGLNCPHTEGISPLRTAWERIKLSKKELAYQASIMDNIGRPDVMLSPSDKDNPMGVAEAERLAKEYHQRFKQGGAGGALVNPEGIAVTPLSFSPKDVSNVELMKFTKLQICNAFGVPISVFDTETSNRSVADAGLYQMAMFAIKPRIRRLQDKLNEKLVPLFDERLFLAFDDCVPENSEFVSTKRLQYCQAGILTRDEVRVLDGEPSALWAKEPLLPSGSLPASTFDKPSIEAPAIIPEAPEPTHEALGPAITSLQQSYYAGQLPREACLAHAQIILGLTMAEADALFPEKPPEPPQPVAPPQDAPSPQAEPVTEAVQPEPVLNQAKAKALLKRTLDPEPDHQPMQEALRKFFDKQRESVLGKVTAKSFRMKAAPFISLEKWDRDLMAEVRPVIEILWSDAAKGFAAQFGLTPEEFKVTSPKIKQALEAWTLKFAQSTNETTSLELNQAYAQLKSELAEGLLNGETYQAALIERVQKVYETADLVRAERIARTESKRAMVTSEHTVAKESGLVKSKQWMLSADPCEACQEVYRKNKEVDLDTPFFVDSYGNGMPPLHPACRCSVNYVLDPSFYETRDTLPKEGN